MGPGYKSRRARSATEEHAVTQEISEHMRRIEIWLALETSAQPPAGVSNSEGQVGCDRPHNSEVFDEIVSTRLEPIGGHALAEHTGAFLCSSKAYQSSAL